MVVFLGQVADIQRALGARMLSGKLSHGATTEELFAIIEKEGTDALIQEGKALFFKEKGKSTEGVVEREGEEVASEDIKS